MSYECKEELGQAVEIGQGVTLVKTTYTKDGEFHSTYSRNTLEGLSDNDIEALAQLAAILKNLPVEGALEFNQEELEEFLKLPILLRLPSTYTDSEGTTNTYTPASLWEASGSCSEWEQSAQEGYDYGRNV